MGVARDCGGEKNGELLFSGFQFGKVKKFWRWMVVMVAQPCEALNITELYT